jgi:hypothetical protein
VRILALDISTQTGIALLEDGILVRNETLSLNKKIKDFGEEPFNYIKFAKTYIKLITDVIQETWPDQIVIEQTTKSRARMSQKILEFLHCCLLAELTDSKFEVYYLSPSTWRKKLNLVLSKEDKKNNAKVRKAKKGGKTKKELGIKGVITRKHAAVKYCNAFFGLDLKMKDNNAADAALLGLAFYQGAREPQA